MALASYKYSKSQLASFKNIGHRLLIFLWPSITQGNLETTREPARQKQKAKNETHQQTQIRL